MQQKPKTKIWNDIEITRLISLYTSKPNTELAILFDTTIYSIKKIANKLQLIKDPNLKSILQSERNKIMNKERGFRDLSVELLTEIALKYKTRSEFQNKDHSAYGTARKLGILDDICKHMVTLSFSYPQLMLYKLVQNLIDNNATYNNRQIIKPKELDIYSAKYKLAFEYDGKGWHQNDIINKSVLCDNIDILLITFIENSRKYQDDIKNQFILNLDIINKRINKNITINDVNNIDLSVIYNNILDMNDVKDICDSYSDFSTFTKNEKAIYGRLSRTKKIDEYCGHMLRDRVEWTEDLIKEEISKYTTLKELLTQSWSCYQFIKRHKEYEYLLNNLKIGTDTKWTEELLQKEISKYSTLQQLKKNSNSCFDHIYYRRPELKYMYAHLKQNIKWTEIMIKEEISKYITLKEFKKQSFSCYGFIKRNEQYKYLLDNLIIK